MSGISTHILDTAAGKPAAGVSVHLFLEEGLLNSVITNQDGRVPDLLPSAFELIPGIYRLLFEVKGPFFPEVTVVFEVKDASAHYHVPLLLSPYGYSTYRGS
jgi:5-hydroxyisourate hydrolase